MPTKTHWLSSADPLESLRNPSEFNWFSSADPSESRPISSGNDAAISPNSIGNQAKINSQCAHLRFRKGNHPSKARWKTLGSKPKAWWKTRKKREKRLWKTLYRVFLRRLKTVVAQTNHLWENRKLRLRARKIRSLGAAGAQLPYKQWVGGSNPSATTSKTAGHRTLSVTCFSFWDAKLFLRVLLDNNRRLFELQP